MKMFSTPKALFCLYTLLNVVLLNNVPLSNDLTLSSPAVSAFPRHLSEVKKNSSSSDSSDNKLTRKLYDGTLANSLFTEHSDNAALLSELSKKEYLVHKNQTLRENVSNKDMVSLLDGFNKLYAIEHERMMNRLSEKLSELQTKCKIPAYVAGELLKECKRSIESEHNTIMNSYKNSYNSYVMSYTSSASSFASFYMRYVRAWNKGLKKSEEKWNKIFEEKANTYKAATPKQ
ncbi:unnamed protein product [Plasmodium vivax]|uniref:(malaria parasite P. vivax) hypothetical protein n=1 Tax=Plasmodium vivax TaxID=5855 RepID=A0A8S4HFJ0_PLAVI|nr:unnamed protein product [Plasmodium vivax]